MVLKSGKRKRSIVHDPRLEVDENSASIDTAGEALA